MDERARTPKRGAIHPLLKMAAIGGVDSAVRLHINRGTDLNATDERGRSALMLAAQRGHARTCRLLLDAGADADLRDSDGLDALAHAQPGLHADVVLVLLEHPSRVRPVARQLVADSAAHFKALHEVDPAIDTSVWEAEPEPVVPESDPEPVLASTAIQGAISAHRLIDRDETWDDVDVRLPDLRPKRGAASDLDDETMASWRTLIGMGLTLGELPASALIDATMQDAIPVEDAEWLLRETLMDFGVLLDGFEPWVADAFGSLPDREEDGENDDVEATTDAAVEHLLALRRDRDRVYWSCLNSAQVQTRIRRSDEAALGAEIESGTEAVLDALARSPFLREALSRSLADAESGDQGGDDDGREEAVEDERDVTSARAAALACDLARARSAAIAGGRATAITADQLRELGAARAPVRQLALVLNRRGIRDDAARQFLEGADRWHRAWSSLVLANLRLSVHLVQKSWKNGVPAADLIQEAHTGLMRAVEKFDFRRGTGLATYAAWWVRARVERHASCATLVRTPTLVSETRRKANQAQRRFEAAGIEFNSADVAAEIGVEAAALHRALALASEFAPIPRLEDDLDDGVEACDPEGSTPEDMASESELRGHVMRHLGSLGARESRVLRLRFGFVDGEDHTLSEIGQEIGVSRERVRQIERGALDRLRRQEGIRELIPTEIPEAPDED